MKSQVAVTTTDLDRHTSTDTHFVERERLRYAGTHLLVDFWQARRLDDLAHVEAALTAAAEATGATVLAVKLHSFMPQGGVTGVAILAESHISVHTWPQEAYAAFDVFVCGDCDAHKALPVLRRYFRPGRIELMEHRRGLKL